MDCTCVNCREPIETNYEEKLKILALGKKMKEYKKIVEAEALSGQPIDEEKAIADQQRYFAQYFTDCGFVKGNEREEQIFHEVVSECLLAFTMGLSMNIQATEEKIANERANLN